MTLPYENATSGTKAIDDLQKILERFGCARFGTMTDKEKGEVILQFSYRDRNISVRASARGYAAAWLKHHPYKSQHHRGGELKHQQRALDQAWVSVYSILRDWVKGQITAVEVGMLTFEGAFLGQILLSNGQSVLEAVSGNGLLAIGNQP
jgi:hypothetical protein